MRGSSSARRGVFDASGKRFFITPSAERAVQLIKAYRVLVHS